MKFVKLGFYLKILKKVENRKAKALKDKILFFQATRNNRSSMTSLLIGIGDPAHEQRHSGVNLPQYDEERPVEGGVRSGACRRGRERSGSHGAALVHLIG